MRQDEKGFGNRCICSGYPDDRYQHYNHGAWRGRHGQTPYRVIENKPPAEYLAGGFLFPAEGYKGPILALAAWQKGAYGEEFEIPSCFILENAVYYDIL